MHRTVAHFNRIYLPLTQTFVYQYLSNHNRYNSLIVGTGKQNLEKFPYEPRYLFMEHSRLDPRFWTYSLLHKLGISSISETYYKSVIQETEPDLLHAHFGTMGVELCTYRKQDRPLVTSFYGADASKFVEQDKDIKKRYRNLFEIGDMFLVEGPSMGEKLAQLGCPDEKIHLQRIAIDTDRIEPQYFQSDDPQRILVVGRFVEKKGIPDAIKAFGTAFDDSSDAELRIVGGEAGEITQHELEQIAREYGVDDMTVFRGYLDYDEYLDEVHNCDILLAPSKTAQSGDSEGGAPTVLLEAQASGKPIVSTTHADIPYVVDEDISGKLVEPGNVKQLADTINWFRNHPDKLRSMGQNGREKIEKQHDVDQLVKQLEDTYDQLLQ